MSYIKRILSMVIVSTISIPMLLTSQVHTLQGQSKESIPILLEQPTPNISRNIERHTDEQGIIYTYQSETLTATVANYVGTASEVFIPSSIVIDGNTYMVTSIGTNAFPSSIPNRLTHVEIPNTVTTIQGNAFSYQQLSHVEIPDSVTNIGFEAFRGNQLTSIKLHNSVLTIGNYAFMGNQLSHIEIPNSLVTIGTEVFRNNQLTHVKIPNSVTLLGDGSFENNVITHIEIPSSVVTIVGSPLGNNPLEVIYTDDGHADSLKDLLGSRAMGGIETELTYLCEKPSHYSSDVILDNLVSLGDSLTFSVIPQFKYVHDNANGIWNDHIPQVQWYKDGEALSDAIDSTKTLEEITEEDLGTYYVVVDGDRLDDIVVRAEIDEEENEEEIEEEIIDEDDDTKGIKPGGITPNEPEQRDDETSKPDGIQTSDLGSGMAVAIVGIIISVVIAYLLKRYRKH